MSGRPDRVRLGYRTIKIEWAPPDAMGEDLGSYQGVDRLIRVADGTLRAERGATLLHEIAHAIYDLYGLRAKDDEERVVEAFATGLSELITRNPDLIDWLKEQLADG